jgi:hypothetical protein
MLERVSLTMCSGYGNFMPTGLPSITSWRAIARRITPLFAVAAMPFVIAACSSGPSSQGLAVKQSIRAQQHEAALKPAIVAAAQTSNGFDVVVSSVTMPESATDTTGSTDVGGYVAVFHDVAGLPHDTAGYVHIKEGTHHNLVVPVHDQLTNGPYFLVLGDGASLPDSVRQPLAQTKIMVTVS